MKAEKPQLNSIVPSGWDLRLWEDVRRNTLSSDFKFIRVTRDAGGTVVSLNFDALVASMPVSNGGLGDSYNGMFKVTQTDESTIKIVDGLDTEAVNCGYVQVNKLTSQDVPVAELTITQSVYIYRQTVAVIVDDIMTSATVSFEQSTTRPEWEAEKAKELLSYVNFADSKITNFSQQYISEKVDIKGAC